MSLGGGRGGRRLVSLRLLAIASIALGVGPSRAAAQGQDGTPFERDVMVLAEMLPGRFDNINQSAFDERLQVPAAQRHERRHAVISRVSLPAFGDRVFVRQDYLADDPTHVIGPWLYVLSADNTARAIRLRVHSLEGPGFEKYRGAQGDASKLSGLTPSQAPAVPGCDVLFDRNVGQFTGRTEGRECSRDVAPRGRATVALEMQVSEAGLWQQEILTLPTGPITGADGAYRLSRARAFECYADIPGVSGGVNTPFKRFSPLALHDKGGSVTFDATIEGQARRVNLMLRNVEWAVNNETNTYTRNSLVMYVTEMDGAKPLRDGYAWSEPRSERVGINLRWILVNCYTESRQSVKPTFN